MFIFLHSLPLVLAVFAFVAVYAGFFIIYLSYIISHAYRAVHGIFMLGSV